MEHVESHKPAATQRPIPYGKYYLLERIDVGGMAEVFRAKAYGVEGFERLIAVKRILPNIAEDKDFITMFIDEAKLAVQLTHANIAQVFDLGVVDGSYYIALEHVFGRDLRSVFDRYRDQGEPMQIAQAAFVMMKVCEGLDYAHNKRDPGGDPLHLVHRDVSPQNILVSFEGQVKLIDFGIAKAAGKGSKTQAGILKGKFGYMSPEQVRGLPIDRRTDIFSCGITLYELLTGERLFVGESDFSTLEKVRNVEILPPSTYNRAIPDELERIVLKALARDVDERYQNAIDLHDDLQAFVYTSGEFFSRKDLAAAMKRDFTAELKAESAKLDAFRQIKPPSVDSRRSKTLPPPPPPAVEGSSERAAKATTSSGKASAVPPASLEWDDDELETAIYDDEPGLQPESLDGAPSPAAAATLVPVAADSAEPNAPTIQEPDLSSLVSSGAAWERPAGSPLPGQLPRVPARSATENVAAFGGNTADVQPRRASRTQKWLLAALLGLAAIGAGILAIALVDNSQSNTPGSTEAKPASVASATPGDNDRARVDTPNQPTGFWLEVFPTSIKDRVRVRLDGQEYKKRLPWKVTGLATGTHIIDIIPPDGYESVVDWKIEVVDGEIRKYRKTLQRERVATTFETAPIGAQVIIELNGERRALPGVTPLTVELRPQRGYRVSFAKAGYKTLTKALEFSMEPEQTFQARLSRYGRVSGSSSRDPADLVSRKDPAESTAVESQPLPSPVQPKPVQYGLVSIAAKPPCRIFVDGKPTGKRTPHRDLRVKAGARRITLINNEHGINKSFRVKIRAGNNPPIRKNYMGMLK